MSPWDEKDLTNANAMPDSVRTRLTELSKSLSMVAADLESCQRECAASNAFPAQQDIEDYRQRVSDLVDDMQATLNDN